MDIFNYYVENSCAAFPEAVLPYEAFDIFLEMSAGLPAAVARDREGRAIGFGMLRSHNQLSVFSHTVEISCFIHPGHTGNGFGGMLFEYLERSAVERGIKNILACVSSLNPGSIRFHQRQGFMECGRFRDVGRKRGKLFDTFWLQKKLKPPE